MSKITVKDRKFYRDLEEDIDEMNRNRSKVEAIDKDGIVICPVCHKKDWQEDNISLMCKKCGYTRFLG